MLGFTGQPVMLEGETLVQSVLCKVARGVMIGVRLAIRPLESRAPQLWRLAS